VANVYDILDTNLDDIFSHLVANDDVKRLLGNNLKTALTDPVPEKDWINDYLFDTPRVPDVQDEVKSFIMIEMNRSTPTPNSSKKFNILISMDVICHESVTRLEKGRRVYKLLSLITSQMKEIRTSSIKGEFTEKGSSKMVYSNEFQGYRLEYSVTNISQDCR